METIESLLQPDELHSELAKFAEVERKQKKTMSSELPLAAIQSLGAGVQPVGQASRGSSEDPQGWCGRGRRFSRRIDSLEKAAISPALMLGAAASQVHQSLTTLVRTLR